MSGEYCDDCKRFIPIDVDHKCEGPGEKRVCCNEKCGWQGETDRYLGAIGPLCPDCGEVTEPGELLSPEHIDGDPDTIFIGQPTK